MKRIFRNSTMMLVAGYSNLLYLVSKINISGNHRTGACREQANQAQNNGGRMDLNF